MLMLVCSSKLKRLSTLLHSFSVKYSTRQMLYYSSVDPQIIKQEEKEREINSLKHRIFNLKSNDSNPANIIKVKIKQPLPVYVPQAKQPFIVRKQIPQMGRILQSRRQGFVSSIKKMREALRGLSGMHIAQALYRMQQSQKKVAKLIIPTLLGLVTTARLRDFELHRLFIHRVLIGKMRRFHSIRYHAKGKSGRMKTDLCCIKIIVQQRSEEKFYGDLALGKVDEGLSQQLRQEFLVSNAPLEEVEKYRDLLTARGRHQHRMIVKRKIDHIVEDKKRNGQEQPRKKVELQVLKQEGQRLKLLLTSRIKEYSQLKQREDVYKLNTQKKGRY